MVSAKNATIINQIIVGGRLLTIVKSDSSIKCILDGTEIISSTTSPRFLEKLPKMVLAITEDLTDGQNCDVLMKCSEGTCQEDNELASAIESEVRERLSANRVLPLQKFRPAILEDVEPLNISIDKLLCEMPQTLNIINNITRILEMSAEDCLTITKRKLIGTMWGADAIHNIMDEVKSDIDELHEESEMLHVYGDLIRKSSSRLKIFKRKTDPDSIRVIRGILIPDITNSFEGIKRFAASLFSIMTVVVHLDESFMRHTSYPSKFFLPGEVIDDLGEDYKLIVGFLNKVPKIEREVINPLDLFRYNYRKAR